VALPLLVARETDWGGAEWSLQFEDH